MNFRSRKKLGLIWLILAWVIVLWLVFLDFRYFLSRAINIENMSIGELHVGHIRIWSCVWLSDLRFLYNLSTIICISWKIIALDFHLLDKEQSQKIEFLLTVYWIGFCRVHPQFTCTHSLTDKWCHPGQLGQAWGQRPPCGPLRAVLAGQRHALLPKTRVSCEFSLAVCSLRHAYVYTFRRSFYIYLNVSDFCAHFYNGVHIYAWLRFVF